MLNQKLIKKLVADKKMELKITQLVKKAKRKILSRMLICLQEIDRKVFSLQSVGKHSEDLFEEYLSKILVSEKFDNRSLMNARQMTGKKNENSA